MANTAPEARRKYRRRIISGNLDSLGPVPHGGRVVPYQPVAEVRGREKGDSHEFPFDEALILKWIGEAEIGGSPLFRPSTLLARAAIYMMEPKQTRAQKRKECEKMDLTRHWRSGL